MRRNSGGKIPADMEPGIRKGALQMIIFEELVYQDAQRRGITVSAEQINKAETDFRQQFSSPAEFQRYLQSEFQGNRKLFGRRSSARCSSTNF